MSTRFRGPVILHGGLSPVASQALLNANSYVQNFKFNLTSFVGASITSATTAVTFDPTTATTATLAVGLARVIYLLQQKRINEGTTSDS